MDEIHKKEFDIKRITHNEINFYVTYEGHTNYSETYFTNIFGLLGCHYI